MTVDFSGRYNPKDFDTKGEVLSTTYDSIENIIGYAPPDMNGIAQISLKFKLFIVYEV